MCSCGRTYARRSGQYRWQNEQKCIKSDCIVAVETPDAALQILDFCIPSTLPAFCVVGEAGVQEPNLKTNIPISPTVTNLCVKTERSIQCFSKLNASVYGDRWSHHDIIHWFGNKHFEDERLFAILRVSSSFETG